MTRTVILKDNIEVQVECDTQEKSSWVSYLWYIIPLLIILYFYLKSKVSGGIVGTTASLISQIGSLAPQIRDSLMSRD